MVVIKGARSNTILKLNYTHLGLVEVEITSGSKTFETLFEVKMAEIKSLREFFVMLATYKEMWYGRASWNLPSFSLTAICEPGNEVRFTVHQSNTWAHEEFHYTLDIVTNFSQLAVIGKSAKNLCSPCGRPAPEE